jgi:hypothetical protein
VVEVHYDLVDRGRAYIPDLPGIWDRAVDARISGYTFRTPSPTDHLLLTIMQLPHHIWSPKLLIDIGYLVSRRRDVIEWNHLMQRAREWGLHALAASALHTLNTMLDVSLPYQVKTSVRPAGYLRRAQWLIVRETVLEQFGKRPGHRFSRIAPFMVLDQLGNIASVVGPQMLLAKDMPPCPGTPIRAVRRVAAGLSCLPSLVKVLVESAITWA